MELACGARTKRWSFTVNADIKLARREPEKKQPPASEDKTPRRQKIRTGFQPNPPANGKHRAVPDSSPTKPDASPDPAGSPA